MSDLALYAPDNRVLDLGHLSPADYQLIASLRGNIRRGDRILLCGKPGGDPEMSVWQDRATGRYWARHFPGGAHGGHEIGLMTPAHLRGTDCWVTAWTGGGLTAATEVTTSNRLRLDAVAFGGRRITALETQVSDQRTPKVKARHTQRIRAKALTGQHARQLTQPLEVVWFAPVGRPEWLYQVPSISCANRAWEVTPAPETVAAIGIRSADIKPCQPPWFPQCPVTRKNWCGLPHIWLEPRGGLSIADVAVMIPGEQLVTVDIPGVGIYYTDPASRERCADFTTTSQPPQPKPSDRPRADDCGWAGHCAPKLPGRQRCGICGSPDHFAKAHTQDTLSLPSALPERPPKGTWQRKPKTGKPACASPGCIAQPPGGAEYCQACRVIRKLRQQELAPINERRGQ